MNERLHNEIEDLFELQLKSKNAVEETTPAHGKLIQPFNWPEGLQSHLNPIDPFVIGLRSKPTDGGVSHRGKVIPAAVVAAFYFVNKHAHLNNDAGNGVRVADASDGKSETITSPLRSRRKRSRTTGRTSAGSNSAEIPDDVSN